MQLSTTVAENDSTVSYFLTVECLTTNSARVKK